MKILVAAAGSHGDVLPLIALARALQRRGHEVRLFASGNFADVAAEAGLPFIEVLSATEYRRLIADRDATDPVKGMTVIADAMIGTLRRSLALLEREFEPGRTLVVGSSLAWAARLLGELKRSPVVSVHLAPSLFRSAYRGPAIGSLGPLDGVPGAVKRTLWTLVDRLWLDPLFAAPFNRIRTELGLPRVDRVFQSWVHAADLNLGLFPAWFSPPQADWPAGLRLTGFPLYDHGGDAPLPPPVERFVAAGDAPVAFTAGTANVSSHAFFEASVRTCRLLRRRAILLTQDAAQLPASLPPEIAHFDYVPFRALLPRVAAFVHHGGIGTTSQALLAGVPQLVRPMAFDQFDNALRVTRLGVAGRLSTRRYRPEVVARELDRLLEDPAIRRRCATIAGRLAAEGSGIEAAADAVLALSPAVRS